MTGQKVRCSAKGTPPSKKKGLCFFSFFWGSRGQRRKRGHQQICPRVSILLRKLEVAKERRKRGHQQICPRVSILLRKLEVAKERRKRGHQQICPRVSILLRKLEVAKERRKRGVFCWGRGGSKSWGQRRKREHQ